MGAGLFKKLVAKAKSRGYRKDDSEDSDTGTPAPTPDTRMATTFGSLPGQGVPKGGIGPNLGGASQSTGGGGLSAGPTDPRGTIKKSSS